MINLFVIFKKLLQKAIALIVWIALTAFYYTFNILFFFYRKVAVVLSVIGLVMTAVDWHVYGFEREYVFDILFLSFAIVLRFLLPLLVPVMQRWLDQLMACIHSPLTVRPPVRYTI